MKDWKKAIRSVLILVLAVMVVGFLTGTPQADVVDSTWQDGSGNWTDPAHWNYPLGSYPNNNVTDTYRVFIYDTGDDPTVNLNTDLTLDYLLNQETLVMTGQTLTLATSAGFVNEGVLDLEGYQHTSYTSTITGGLTNNGAINLNKYGAYNGRGNLTYDGSDLRGSSGQINVADGALLTLSQNTDLHGNTVNLNNGKFRADSGFTLGQINGSGQLAGVLGGPVSVSGGTMTFTDPATTIASTGSMDVSGTGVLDMVNKTLTNNGELTVQSGGVADMRNSTIDNTGGGSAAVQSGGTLNVNGHQHTSYTSTITGGLTNNGAINLNKYGAYNGRGDLTYDGSDLWGGGQINIADGALLTLSQNTDLHGNTVSLSNGKFRSDSGFTLGQINGYGQLAGVLGGPVSVSGGTMTFTDPATTISSTGSMDVLGTGTLDMVNKTLTNNGELTVQSGGVADMRNSTMDNTGGGAAVIESGGTLNFNGYFHTSYTSTITGGLTNNGAINLNKYGAYNGRGNLIYDGPDLWGGGQINIADGALLTLSQDTDLHGNTVSLSNGKFRSDSGFTLGQINGYGQLAGVLGGPVSVSGGTMTFTDPATTIASTGSMDVSGTGTLDMVGRSLTNNGQLTVQSGGKLEMRESTIDNTGGGSAAVQSGGTLNVNGYQHSSYTSTITGGLTNNGTINLNKYGAYSGVGRLNVEGGLFLSNGSRLYVSENNTLTVDGDFAMGLTDETDFDWGANSELVLTGGAGASGPVGGIWDDWAYFETGGSDFGDDPAAHQGDPNGFLDNFELVELVIGEGAHVYLGDYLDNGNRGGEYAYDEALYVDTLVLSSDSMLNLNGLNLYYNNLVGDISQIIDVEVPHSEQVPLPPAVFLLASGLLGLAGLRKRLKN